LQGYVWSPTGRHSSQQTALETPPHSWLLQATAHTRLIQAQILPCLVQPCNRQLQYQVHWQRQPPAPPYNALRKETYDIVEDRVGNLYCGINLSWHYDKGYVNLSLPKYVMKQLTHYAHSAPVRPQHCPFFPNPITYGKDNQATTPADDSPLLNNAGKKRIQQVVGSFLYYARAIDTNILMALSDIATQQAVPTENTKK
jgi:hypothetical protein